MEKILSVLALVLAAVALLVSGFMVAQPTEVEIVEVPVVETIVVSDNASLIKLNDLEDKINSLEEFEIAADEEKQNTTAKDLALAELEERNFMRSVTTLLNDEDMSVDSYKDLEIYSIEIDEVELDGEDAEVEVTIKVSGFNDEDEDDDFKVRINVLFEIEDLDVDELEDAEVADYSLRLEKVYD